MPRLADRNVIGTRTVLKNKLKPYGTMERRKSRIVVRGFTQRPGFGYHDTFAPVARLESVRLLMAIATELKAKVQQ